MQLPEPLERLIAELSRLPGVGPKTAQRLAFHLLRADRERVERLAEVLVDLKLDSQDAPRPEIALPEFQLPAEVVRLMDLLDSMVTTTVESLEVRAGIPRRIVFRVSADSPANVDVATEGPEARR